MSDSRVVDHLEDEIWKSPSKMAAVIYEELSDSEIYSIAAAAIAMSQYSGIKITNCDPYQEMLAGAFKKCMAAYIETHRERAERELRQMDADNEADARADEMRDAA